MSYLVNSSATKAVAVTTSDTANLSIPSGLNGTKGIYIGASGDVKVDMEDGTTVTFKAMAAGVFHGISVKRVYTTGTTATDIVAVY